MDSPLFEGQYHRFVAVRLAEALSDTPVVLIHGPRQCGKTTLAKAVGQKLGHVYRTFDDDRVLAAATADPVGFVADLPRRVILDEVQRAPGIFTSLKAEIDRDRAPGRFLLTGSTNVLLVPRLADSLAGRMGTVRLHPLAQSEIARKPSDLLDRIVDGRIGERSGAGDDSVRLGRAMTDRIVAGGFPAALARASDRRRSDWYLDYIDSIVQRDVRELARISSLDVMPRLLAVAAGRTAQLLNIADLAAPFQLSRPTIADYLTLLERVFLVDRLPAWHINRTSRQVKSPKLHLGDTGVAATLLGIGADELWSDRETYGQLLETFVFQELRRAASWSESDIRFHHYRDRDGSEVDIVLERGARRVAGIEVKAGSTVTAADFRGLRKLASVAGDRFVQGVVLYDGGMTLPFGERLHAVPIWRLWADA